MNRNLFHMAVLLRLRRTRPLLLHCRFLSSGVCPDPNDPFSSYRGGYVIRDRFPYAPDPRLPTFILDSFPNSKPPPPKFVSSDQIQKKWKQLTVSLLSLRERYTSDVRAISEMFKSRQAFLTDMINNLNPPPPPSPDLSLFLKEMMVKEHDLSGQLTSSRLSMRLTSLQVIINIFSEQQRKKEDELLSPELIIIDNSSPIPQVPSSRITVPERENRWNEVSERWNELNERQMRLKEMESKNPSLQQKLHTSKTMIILKEMFLTEDEMAAKLTNLRITSLEGIINNLSEIRHWTSAPLPLDEGHQKMWDKLNDDLMKLREMELGDAMLLAVRTNHELTSLSQSIKELSDNCCQISLSPRVFP